MRQRLGKWDREGGCEDELISVRGDERIESRLSRVGEQKHQRKGGREGALATELKTASDAQTFVTSTMYSTRRGALEYSLPPCTCVVNTFVLSYVSTSFFSAFQRVDCPGTMSPCPPKFVAYSYNAPYRERPSSPEDLFGTHEWPARPALAKTQHSQAFFAH